MLPVDSARPTISICRFGPVAPRRPQTGTVTALRGAPGADLERVLARSRADLADLQAEFAALADPGEVAIDDEHDSEGATIGFERARVAGLIARTRLAISGLEEALVRVADGTYGRCEKCGGAVGEERLVALPGTTRCIRCAAVAPSLWTGSEP